MPGELLDALGVVTDADLAADGAWRFAPTGSASLQLDAHTHQQEQAEIERLEGRRVRGQGVCCMVLYGLCGG